MLNLEEFFGVEIEVNRPTENDIEALLIQYHNAERALKNFLDLKISFADYCDILEFNEVNMDEFLAVIDNNLSLVS